MKYDADRAPDGGSTDFLEALLSRHRAALVALERHYEDHLSTLGVRSRPLLRDFLKLAFEEVRNEAKLLDEHLEGSGSAFPARPPARMLYLALGEDALLRDRLMIILGLAYEKDQTRRLPGTCLKARATGNDAAELMLERLLRGSKRRARELERFLKRRSGRRSKESEHAG